MDGMYSVSEQPASSFAGMVSLLVCEVYPSFRNAYACNAAGQRFLLNDGSAGIDFDSISEGQTILAHVNERNYIDRACLPG